MIKIRRGMWCKIVITMVILVMPFIATSQPGDPGEDPDNPVPIGGVEILLLAGGALGIRKMVASKKSKKS